MNWIKKQWNKLFPSIDDDYENEYEYDEKQEMMESEQRKLQAQMQTNRQNRSTFRFPLIADEELGTTAMNNRPPYEQENVQPIQLLNDTVDQPLSSQVYDVEVSGLSELLAQRREGKGSRRSERRKMEDHTNIPLRNVHRERPTKQTEKVEKTTTSKSINPLENRKRFVPTEVPSPVYGFQKPRSINDLLKKDTVMKSEQAEVIDEETKEEQNSDNIEKEVVKGTEEVASSVVTTVETEEIEQHDHERTEQFVEKESVDEKEVILLEDEEVQATQKSVNLHVESLSDNPPMNQLEQQETEEPTVKKRGALPFNVIMLKSDKEKLLKKVEIEQLSQSTIEDVNKSKQQKQLQHSQVAKLLERASEGENIEQQAERAHESTNLTTENDDRPDEEQQTNRPTLPEKQYVKPPLEYLAPPEEKLTDKEWMESQADVLVESLSHFQVTAHVESIVQGPAVTQFEITVGQGTKVSKIRNLADDLKLALAAKDIRIQAPIPGKSSIGIEIPNRISRAVQLSEITSSDSFIQSDSPLEAALGLDLTGTPVTIDLRKMPHGMIAGATGSGKSVCINSILVSLLYKADPQQLKLMLIDPKMVELAPFNHIPHLVSPVITDVKAATAALKWAVDEMERRYKLFAHVGVRDLSRFNKLAEQNEEYGHKLPYILIVIDELADLMMMSPADVEEAICRIAQKARACGIHLIIATQRPSVDVITGLIKSNIPTRIAFAVSSQVDSRTILDQPGAERLLGRGDMLYLGNGMSAPIRLQGTFVTDDEIEQIVDHVREQGEPDYFFEQEELLKKAEMVEESDELFEEVCRFVYEQGSASTSSLQRRFHIGYNRAARLVDMLESHGFVSETKGSKPRDVFITESDLTRIFG